jgi:osmotically inducible lipoprotein OsmB
VQANILGNLAYQIIHLGITMNIPTKTNSNSITKRLIGFAFIATTLLIMGCSGMSNQDRNTAAGAGIGAVGGAILTGGSAAGTVGGAAIGGVIGHEIDK